MVRVLLAVTAMVLAVAAPARAGGTLVEPSSAHRGPVFAGDRIVWAERDAENDAYRVHAATPDGSGQTVQIVEAPELSTASNSSFEFDASQRRVALSTHATRYYNRKDAIAELLHSRLVSGPTGGTIEPFASQCTSSDLSRQSVAVDGDVVAALVECGSKTRVRDFAAPEGERRDFELPGAARVRLAGPYLARHDGREVVVDEWRTGVERLRVPSSTQAFDVEADGTLAFVTAHEGRARVMTASPHAPEPRLVADDGGDEVRIAGDRVAYERAAGGVAVRRVDGALVAESDTAGLTDFDGQRLAWVDHTCARSAVATWDLQGAAPALPRANPCPIATLRSTTLRATSGAWGSASVRVKLACAAEPQVGCQGSLTLFGKDSRRKYGGRLVDMTRGYYRLGPGETTTVAMGYLKHRICIAGDNARTPFVDIGGPAPQGSALPRVKRRRVRVVGLDAAMASCSA